MKKFRNLFFYIGVTGGASLLIYWIIILGRHLEIGRNIIKPASGNSNWNEFLISFVHNLQHPLAILLAQIVTIILAARLFGWICRKIGQPTVMGEIIAGIVLGPSVLGMYFPQISSTLFPVQSLGNLQFLSQIGLILFMFVVGMELDLKVLKNKANHAVVVSHASIVIPFTLGMGLAYYLYNTFAPARVQFLSFGLFLAIAMSITAFPVLARIAQERGIHKTKLGSLVITCAAADDITAWSLLAAVIAVVKAGSLLSSLYTIVLAVSYVFLMLKVVKPFLKRVGELHVSRENLSKPVVAIFFLTLILSAWATEIIGIHALFGAFMTGVIMPTNSKFRNIFIEKIEDVALVLLLPLFFVFTGLRTEIGLLNNIYLWEVCGLIIAVAVTGKFIGSTVAAKFIGQSWRDSLVIGALMNTRGLMELVVLNIGYDLGIIGPEIFAMMVIMALTTTFMTGPALDLINYLFKSKESVVPQVINDLRKYKILISFGNSERGKVLLRLANNFTKNLNGNSAITVMHLSPINELNHYNTDEYEKESFAPIVTESFLLNRRITTLFKASNNIDSDIVDVANNGDYDLLLVGIGQSIFEGSLLGKVLGFTTRIINPDRLLGKLSGTEKLFENSPFDDRTRQIINNCKVPVGVFINKELNELKQVFVPFISESDTTLIPYIQKLINNSDVQISIFDIEGSIKNRNDIKESIRMIEHAAAHQISLYNKLNIDHEFLQKQDLMLVSLEGWKTLVNTHNIWLKNTPSVLIVKP